MRYKVFVGEPFEIDSTVIEGDDSEVISARAEALSMLARMRVGVLIAALIVALGTIMVLGAAIIGVIDGSFDELGAVWDNMMPMIAGGFVSQAISGKQDKDDGAA